MRTTRFANACRGDGGGGNRAVSRRPPIAKPSGNWRIEFNHQADNDGADRVSHCAGRRWRRPIDVETKVPEGNHREQCRGPGERCAQGDARVSENYRIGTDDGEDVVVKTRGKTKKFELTMVSTSLTGLEIKVKHN